MPTRLLCRLGWHQWQALKVPGQTDWYRKCRACGKRDAGEALPWLGITLSAITVVAGVVVTLTLRSLLGPVLIVGGTLGLCLVVLPTALERLGALLATGVRRKS